MKHFFLSSAQVCHERKGKPHKVLRQLVNFKAIVKNVFFSLFDYFSRLQISWLGDNFKLFFHDWLKLIANHSSRSFGIECFLYASSSISHIIAQQFISTFKTTNDILTSIARECLRHECVLISIEKCEGWCFAVLTTPMAMQSERRRANKAWNFSHLFKEEQSQAAEAFSDQTCLFRSQISVFW